MSLKLLTLVYDGYPKGGSEFDVLLALANSTHEETGRCFPSISYISWKTRQSERTVQYALKQLALDGWIKLRKGQGQSGTNLYVLNRRKLDASAILRKKEYEEKRDKKNSKLPYPTWDDEFGVEIPDGDEVHNLQVQELHPRKKEQQGVQSETEGVQSDAVGGATGCTLTGEPEINRKEPIFSADAEESTKVHDLGVVEKAFLYYCAKFGRNPKQYSLTPLRRDKALMRLRERTKAVGFDDARREIKSAIDNLTMSDYHCTNGYVDWVDQIFKSAEEFEKRLNWKPANGNSQKQLQEVQKIHDTVDNFAEARRRILGEGAGREGVRPAGEIPGQVGPVLEPAADLDRAGPGLVRRAATLHG